MKYQNKTKAQLIRELEKLQLQVAEHRMSEQKHKRAEEKLKESEEKFRSFVETSDDLIFRLTKTGYIQYVSPRVEALYGYQPDELIGKHLKNTTPVAEIPKALKAINEVLHGKTIKNFVINQKKENGQIFPMEINAVPVKKDGKIIGVQGIMRDITGRKQAEQVLRESEAQNRAILEAIPDLMFLISRDGEFLSYEAAAKDLYTDPAQFLNKNIYDVLPKELAELTMHYIRRSFESGKIQIFEYQLPTGSKAFDWEARMVKVSNDKVLSIIRDVTEHKQAEEALRESEEKYRNLIQQSNDAIYLLYKKRFEIINEKFQDIFGLTLEEVNKPEFNLMDLVAPESKTLIEERERRLANGEELEPIYEFTAITKDGKEIEVEVSTSHIKYKGGIATQGILHDITERKSLEQQLRHSNKMESIGTLAGGIAHDFNNLLTVINGHAEMTLMKCEKDHPLYKNIVWILHAGKKAENLTRQLLAFSRRQITEPKIIDINILISDLDKMMRRLIGEDISMGINLIQDIALIKADQSQIEQIIINLIVNARDAINQRTDLASEKKITLETDQVYLDESYVSKHVGSQTGLHIIISVSDNGIGMDEETKNKIFEPFFTTKEIGQGTGLGLATVYGIVKQNQGSIYVYSEQGQGTTIKIYWPSTEEKKVSDVTEKTSEDKLAGNETVLLVEDDKGVIDFAYAVLEELGYSVYRASNGKKALELTREKNIQFDLVITDLIMPEMNGKELAAALKKLYPEILIIFTSGYTDNHIIHSGPLDKGVNFIQKPYSVQMLAQKVRKILDKK
ncbi:MAG: PAS domain S-box protein [Candidatus Aminicenantes bacterium]|nr:PAS domain S-box protein [Candidatus Aminicenantes bacterium]